jgi:hypothetical protein
VAEIIFTFITHDKSANNPTLILLSYLIEKTTQSGNNPFLNSMFSYNPPTKPINIMDLTTASAMHYAYVTCIPYLEKGKNIGGMRAFCMVGEKPIKVSSDLLKQLNFSKYRLPSTILMTNDRQAIINYSVSSNGMTKPEISNVGQTYSNSADVNDVDFSNRFMLFEFIKKTPSKTKSTRIEGFVNPQENTQEGGNATTTDSTSKTNGSKFVTLDDLKCYPINTKTDINGKMLLIDPTTGKKMSMTEYLQESNKLDVSQLNQEIPEKKAVQKTFAIVLGSIIGALGGLILLSIVISYLFKSSKQSAVGSLFGKMKGAFIKSDPDAAKVATIAAATLIASDAVQGK